MAVIGHLTPEKTSKNKKLFNYESSVIVYGGEMRRLMVGSALLVILLPCVLGTTSLTMPVYAKSVGKKVLIF